MLWGLFLGRTGCLRVFCMGRNSVVGSLVLEKIVNCVVCIGRSSIMYCAVGAINMGLRYCKSGRRMC